MSESLEGKIMELTRTTRGGIMRILVRITDNLAGRVRQGWRR